MGRKPPYKPQLAAGVRIGMVTLEEAMKGGMSRRQFFALKQMGDKPSKHERFFDVERITRAVLKALIRVPAFVDLGMEKLVVPWMMVKVFEVHWDFLIARTGLDSTDAPQLHTIRKWIHRSEFREKATRKRTRWPLGRINDWVGEYIFTNGTREEKLDWLRSKLEEGIAADESLLERVRFQKRAKLETMKFLEKLRSQRVKGVNVK